MPSFDQVISTACERLLEDERLRSNLTDAEANVVLNWAMDWLERSIRQARDEAEARRIAERDAPRVREAVLAINDRASGWGARGLTKASKAVEPLLGKERAPTRAEIDFVLTATSSEFKRAPDTGAPHK
ncbi:MAG: hypothetical protein M1132_00610 [Chloroflexi bacterium]|nr:hypothetical protein [Chloroflexota bacterium]